MLIGVDLFRFLINQRIVSVTAYDSYLVLVVRHAAFIGKVDPVYTPSVVLLKDDDIVSRHLPYFIDTWPAAVLDGYPDGIFEFFLACRNKLDQYLIRLILRIDDQRIIEAVIRTVVSILSGYSVLDKCILYSGITGIDAQLTCIMRFVMAAVFIEIESEIHHVPFFITGYRNCYHSVSLGNLITLGDVLSGVFRIFLASVKDIGLIVEPDVVYHITILVCNNNSDTIRHLISVIKVLYAVSAVGLVHDVLRPCSRTDRIVSA